MRMKSGKRIVVVAVVVAIVVTLTRLLTKPEPEPEFGGKPLSYWVDQNIADYPRRNQEAIAALRAMGRPAVKRLTRMVEEKDSFWREQIAEHGDKLPILNENLPVKYWHRGFAARALGAIGTNAASSIPALEKMSAESDKILAQAAQAALVLVRGESMDKLLADYLNYSDHTNSTKAFGMLMALGPYAEDTIPALLGELQSTNDRIRIRVVLTLQTVGVESQACVSAMTNLLDDPNRTIRYSAAHALANSGPLAKDAIPMVIRLLDDQDNHCRSTALIFLHFVVTSNEFAPYRNAVQQMTNDPDESVRDWSKIVLEEK